MRLSSLAPAFALLTVALAASADTYDVVGTPDLAFTAVGPGGLKINGTSESLKAFEEQGNLVFKASLANIKTGIGLRDNHTKKYLGTDQWPDASLTVEKSAVKMHDDGKKSSGSAPGKFRLHGVTKDVKVAYTVERHCSDYSVEGHFPVNIIDHKIEKPCYLGVCVGEVIKVTADLTVHGS